MSQGPNRVMDEFAKLMTDAAGVAQGVRREAETAFKSQAERITNSMDLVSREDFDALKEMAVLTREENLALKDEVDALKARLEALEDQKPTPLFRPDLRVIKLSQFFP